MGLFGPDIEELKASGDIQGLVDALYSRRKHVVQDAIKALGVIGEPAIPALVPVIAECKGAGPALALIGKPAEPYLRGALRSADPMERYAAALAFLFLRPAGGLDAASIRALEEVAESDPSPDIRAPARVVLKNSGVIPQDS